MIQVYLYQLNKNGLISVKKKEVKTIEDYNRLSLIHKTLPKDPEDFYNAFSNIANELQLFNN
jgi:hypothetical protein